MTDKISLNRYQKKNTRFRLAKKRLERWKSERTKTLHDPRFVENKKTCMNCFKILNEEINLIEDKFFKNVSCPVCHRSIITSKENFYSKRKQDFMKKIELKFKNKGSLSDYPINNNRLEIITKLSNSKCERCGFDDIRALQLDHIKGDGSKDRKRFKNIQYLWLYYNEHPEIARKKLQVLCANCNWIKRSEKNENSWHARRKKGNLEVQKNLEKWNKGLRKINDSQR